VFLFKYPRQPCRLVLKVGTTVSDYRRSDLRA